MEVIYDRRETCVCKAIIRYFTLIDNIDCKTSRGRKNAKRSILDDERVMDRPPLYVNAWKYYLEIIPIPAHFFADS